MFIITILVGGIATLVFYFFLVLLGKLVDRILAHFDIDLAPLFCGPDFLIGAEALAAIAFVLTILYVFGFGILSLFK